MSLPKYFISGDWGTTNFRLRVVETDTLNVLFEHKTDQGIKPTFMEYSNQSEVSQQQFFLNYLKTQVPALPVEHQNHLIILSGMASANIGMLELEYAVMPFGASGDNFVWKYLPNQEGVNILLISGARNDVGVMRGEEIQAIGLAEYLEAFGEGILLLPGTHCKHITYENGVYTELKTFMTGEVFELLSKKSILSNNVTPNKWGTEREVAFKEGLVLGMAGKLSENLFSIRVKNLIQGAQKEDNYFMLSGLLIGDELSYLKNSAAKIFLAAPASVGAMYQLALEQILNDNQLEVFDNQTLEKALLIGQKKILTLYAK